MATINNLTAATALGGADKFLIETPLGPKSISGNVLKEQVTADSLKKGKVIFDEPDGMQVTTISMSIGKRYDMYLNSRFERNPDKRLGRQIVSVVATPSSTAGAPSNFVFPVFIVKSIDTVISGVFAFFSVYGLFAAGELKELGIYYPGGGSVQEEFYIYKIVEYDEV